MNNITKEQRSAIMRSIKNKDTKIEIILRKALWHQGIRYRKNYKAYSCRIDIAITKYKVAIFCDGEFWHGKQNNYIFKNNEQYWNNKIKRNVERDLENTIELRDNNWIVLRFWETEIYSNLNSCINTIMCAIQKNSIKKNN